MLLSTEDYGYMLFGGVYHFIDDIFDVRHTLYV